MKKVLLPIVFVAGLATSNAQVLKVWQTSLIYQNGDKLITVKGFKRQIELYGYAMVDSTHVFVAYQPEDEAEAGAIIQIVDLVTGKPKYIGQLGGTGESMIDYNTHNGFVVLNWGDGIGVLDLKNPAREKNGFLAPRIVFKSPYCWEARWLDQETIGFTTLKDASGEFASREFRKIKFRK